MSFAKREFGPDRSKKGSVDDEIRPLVGLINSIDDFYTTSSCAGRIVLIEKGKTKNDVRWLVSSHSPLKGIDISAISIRDRPVWLLLESPILHICSRDISSGNRMIRCAKDAGFKRAVFYSISKRVMVEIVGSERVEAIVADSGEWIVGQHYMDRLVGEANIKMAQFRKKLECFTRIIKGAFR